MTLTLHTVTRPGDWTSLWQAVQAHKPQPLQQSWGYGAALAIRGVAVARQVVYRERDPIAMAQLVGRRLVGGLVRLTLALGGPAWIAPDIDPTTRVEALRLLRRGHSRWRRRFLVLQPEWENDDTAARAALRGAGLRRVMTGTVPGRLDLAADEDALRADLQGKWRNALARAERGDLTVSLGGAKPKAYQWLLEQESAQRGLAGYMAAPVDLVPSFAQAQQAADKGAAPPVLTATALQGREKVAGQLFLIHGQTATYHIGWTGPEGREADAHTLLLWQAMMALRDRGIRWLDLGPVDTGPGAGIARFKLGTGTRAVPLVGSWA